MVVVVDDEDREDEGDLVMAAEHATHEALAFFIRHTSGLVCVAIDRHRAEALQLPPMVADGDDPRGTAFTVSVDLKEATTTGVSAADRARTIRALVDPDTQPAQLSRPGHVFRWSRATAGYCAALATPRVLSICADWRASDRLACCVRSPTRTARWRDGPTCLPSPRSMV